MIYLDWNATAPLRPAARSAWLAAQDTSWGNPSSVHGIGQRARAAIDGAKTAMARLLGCRGYELVLTSGGSEANALAIHAALSLDPQRNSIVASAIEHSSVLRNASARGALTVVGVDPVGRIDPAALAAACGPATALVCFQYANNEIGTLQEIPALIAAVRAVAPAALILLDAAQGAGKRPLHLGALGVDFASIAGHKFGAPLGAGLLYARTGLKVPPLIHGGRQQQDRRSGTEDVAGAVALAAALGDALHDSAQSEERCRNLLDSCFSTIAAELPEAAWIARAAPRLGHTLSLAHPGIDQTALVQRLDLAGIAVSTGAACMAARGEPSHVLRALGIASELARGAIRVSIGHQTTTSELDAFAAAYVREVRLMLR
ncbi:cysteine desulfurase NifS [Planctomycetota bacterium]|nr:cysteine desulfurase NifS [Planctomycetota bacterium]